MTQLTIELMLCEQAFVVMEVLSRSSQDGFARTRALEWRYSHRSQQSEREGGESRATAHAVVRLLGCVSRCARLKWTPLSRPLFALNKLTSGRGLS
jgi:hypothetical protein